MRRILIALLAITSITGCASTQKHQKESLAFLYKPTTDHIRIMHYNVNWDAIFPLDTSKDHKWKSHDKSAEFKRVLAAVKPDIVSIQEINWDRNPQEVGDILDEVLPLPNGKKWQVHSATDCVIGSRYNLTMKAGDTVPKTNRGHAAALIDLPDKTCKKDLYMISAHFKSAGKPKDIKRRQQHADAIISWVRDIKEQGGNIDLPKNTPVVILGDFNVYDTDPHHHLTTLITGDIEDEKTYGPDIAPDWDSTDLRDALPVHNGKGNLTYTWRNDTDRFNPGPLDRIIYTDSVMVVNNSFVLNTASMTSDELTATDLQAGDVALELDKGLFDHLPVVIDFVLNE